LLLLSPTGKSSSGASSGSPGLVLKEASVPVMEAYVYLCTLLSFPLMSKHYVVLPCSFSLGKGKLDGGQVLPSLPKPDGYPLPAEKTSAGMIRSDRRDTNWEEW
jgi:hypothetical protein